jgi:hypothetical protein
MKKSKRMRWWLNILFLALLVVTAAFTARYIKAEALSDHGQVSAWRTTAAVKMR